jgi:predicted SAM-dependent methyltransferase
MGLNETIKDWASIGIRRAWRALRNELHIMRTHWGGLQNARSYAGRKKLRINFGSGPNYKKDWVNIDISNKADLQLDLREKIPLQDGCAKMIYSEHFFEHLEYPGDAMRFLTECHRLLEPGGVVSIGVPDTCWPLQSYAGIGDCLYFKQAEAMAWHPSWCKTPLEHINYHFRQGNEHRFAYDFETLQRALSEAKFIEIRQREYDPSLDTERRRVGTLYVDATRP